MLSSNKGTECIQNIRHSRHISKNFSFPVNKSCAWILSQRVLSYAPPTSLKIWHPLRLPTDPFRGDFWLKFCMHFSLPHAFLYRAHFIYPDSATVTKWTVKAVLFVSSFSYTHVLMLKYSPRHFGFCLTYRYVVRLDRPTKFQTSVKQAGLKLLLDVNLVTGCRSYGREIGYTASSSR
jgi:hypothetical protein